MDLEGPKNCTAVVLLWSSGKPWQKKQQQKKPLAKVAFLNNLEYLMTSLIDSIGPRGKVVQNEIYRMIWISSVCANILTFFFIFRLFV